MEGSRSHGISLSTLQRRILEAVIAPRRCAQGLATRARMVLLWSEGQGVRPTARRLRVDVKTVRLWRKRWADAAADWQRAGEEWEPNVWQEKIEQVLCDAARSGAPSKFQAEQVCQIIAVACKNPQELGLPISHWSATDLQREVLKQKIVPSISARQVGRFLKRRTSNRTACAIT